MAKDASEYLTSLGKSASSLAPSAFFFQYFSCRTEFLSYLILCVVKMPFVPPVSIARSVSGLTGKETSINRSSSSTSVAKTRESKEDKGGSVKERLTLNLKQLGKKSQPRSHLPTATKGASGAELHSKRRDRLVPSSQTDSLPASSSGESLSKTQRQKPVSQSSVKSEPEVKMRPRHEEEEARFTLTLTPEAVLLLQRRSTERPQRSAVRNAESVAGNSGSATDSRRRRENVSKRHQTSTQRHSAPISRAPVKNNSVAELGDIRSILKISLLNEQHKYDDVEYEDEGDMGVDERVVLKCTEWLRGLENTPVTVGNGLSKSVSGVKSF
ncbi:proline-rich protein 18-like [Paralichthys olivaceus]|uniref:proline-rich protein 18-like n=1 Tax=Paralichthys olivaceus TaxID=8255 RepID=UPI00097CFFCA|nr:PREDICTED: proline-rich protein 18-like [Paralichthys olivaceus]